MSEQIMKKALEKGIGYDIYFGKWLQYLDEVNPEMLEGQEKNFYDYRKLNKQRSSRVQKTYKVSDELQSVLDNLEEPQTWMVLTENWCGDSAQILPYIAKIAEASDKIVLRILYRDDNLEIMDEYLTDGKSRSIPKLVAFDKEGNELFQWGPRPVEAQIFVKDALAKGREKQKVYQELHLWYSRYGAKEMEKEFSDILEKVTNNQSVR